MFWKKKVLSINIINWSVHKLAPGLFCSLKEPSLFFTCPYKEASYMYAAAWFMLFLSSEKVSGHVGLFFQTCSTCSKLQADLDEDP